ncbi:hypothetical protein ABLU85_19015 [Klebsiella sp. GG_Kp154]|uniref:hypothetical protein n=1 Tax=Klebsiella TaxID=570 RepID=UPI000E2CCDD1|nr:hypothetical protein [Klebsiella variicola]EIX9713468.1 hypothetical protein [Klebsiella pneumoniae]EKX8075316.1 hypothetical protein [Escherichia coli]HCD1335512.1 hypothetical protein [Klebsiella variicola subsp. variicola]HDH1312677.1 hypothetical protein [Klebsiella quasipneumoniae subsp. similipneumoniae]EKU8622982.1 hypothetical protein [Klebsiella variicola]
MSTNFPSSNFYTLTALDINMHQHTIEFNPALLDRLSSRTLTGIRNSFERSILVWENGLCYFKISELNNLLRTSNSGAHNVYVRQGVNGYVSPSNSYEIDNELYISGPDFSSLLDFRINSSYGDTHLYLKYVRTVYQSISALSVLNELRTSFVRQIDSQRNQLKTQRIISNNIRQCEFSGHVFSHLSEVQFAHIESVTTSPLLALNINNGVIICNHIHANLTREGIHDFAGMYEFCRTHNYSTLWADNYVL